MQDENLPAISMFVQASMDRFVSKKHPMLSHEIYVEQEIIDFITILITAISKIK